MKIGQRQIQRQVGEFIQRCRSRKLSVTHQRLAIYQALLRTSDHPTAEAIFQAVRQQIPTISLATVYKTLDTLEQEGMIRKVSFSHQAAARYDVTVGRHHHLFCLECHRVEDLHDDRLDGLHISKNKAAGYQIIDYTVQVNGVCPACQVKRRRRRGLDK